MTACNDCWDEAFRRSQIGDGHQVEHYEAILLLHPSERPWCAFAQSQTRAQRVERIGDGWVGTCNHGTEVWTIHRNSEYAARRSLAAHASGCTRVFPPGSTVRGEQP